MSGSTGVWLVGACGNVGMLTVAGARAIARGLADRTGLVTDLAELRALPLPPLDSLVFGGHEVSPRTLAESAAEFRRRAGVLTESLCAELDGDLRAAQGNVRPGFPGVGAGAGPRAAVAAIRRDLDAFRERHGLSRVVVVNVATTERLPKPRPEWESLEKLQAALRGDRAEVFPASMLYAYAALDSGCAYVNFTPSTGASVPAMEELARARGTVHAGRDGKTGETLVKTTLAPLFALRNLEVLSWEGYNMLGNKDGAALQDPEARHAKTTSKDRSLKAILRGQKGHSSVHIDYVPSLDDWKVAYDFIHFQGFLGARMSLQFTWQGCDSALAAPLVLDLARLAALALDRGESGALPHLACFFKDPAGTEVHAFPEQFDLLRRYVQSATPRSDARSA